MLLFAVDIWDVNDINFKETQEKKIIVGFKVL